MIIGIDIGTQSLKAVVLDNGLGVCGDATTPYQPSFPKPGWVEQAPDLWETALAPTISQALARAGKKAGDIEALGIGGQ